MQLEKMTKIQANDFFSIHPYLYILFSYFGPCDVNVTLGSRFFQICSYSHAYGYII